MLLHESAGLPLCGAADGHTIDFNRRDADSDWNGLSIFAAGADAFIEFQIVADHRNPRQHIGSVADQGCALDRGGDLSIFNFEALDSVAGAAGNILYYDATKKIQNEVSTGTSLTNAMQNSEVFPNMVLQMVAIGEESGALDSMLGKVADFYEAEVDDMVDALSSLMEPVIMVVLGTLIGGLVIAMYLPIFKMGSVV